MISSLCDEECLASFPERVTLPSGLQYVDFKLGTGASPVPGFQVTVNYVAMNADGRAFDNSIEKGFPYDIRCFATFPKYSWFISYSQRYISFCIRSRPDTTPLHNFLVSIVDKKHWSHSARSNWILPGITAPCAVIPKQIGWKLFFLLVLHSPSTPIRILLKINFDCNFYPNNSRRCDTVLAPQWEPLLSTFSTKNIE